MAIALRFAARSDVGLLRSGNEDSAYAGPRLLAVADGVGGAVAGEVASSIVIATLAPLDDDPPGPDLLDRLARTVTDANGQLRMLIGGDSSLEGMGTTLTALLRAGNKLGLVHVGDSRGYLLRDGELCQITKDHSWVQALVDDGRISAEEALQHPQRSLILRVLDGREETALDLSVREARTGDRYLLCSDGVTDVVRDETVREALVTSASPAEACERLVDLALRAGGPDNITCVVADVVDVEAAPSVYPEVVGAATDSSSPRRTGGDSAAVKAAALGAGSTAAAPAATPDREARTPGRAGRVFRRGVLLLVLVALLVGGTGAAYAWSQRQYYVGMDGEVVAIYRGVDQRLAGLALSEIHERTPLRLADLPDFARRKVADGTIAASDLEDARRIVSGLGDQAAACRQEAGSAATGAGGTATASSTATQTPATGTAVTAGTATPGTPAPGPTSAPASPTPAVQPGADRAGVRGGDPLTPTAPRATVTPQGTRSRRNIELLLLVPALALPLLAWAQVDLVLEKRLPPSLGAYAAGLGGLLLVAHLAVRRFAKYADPVLLPVVALLNGLGLVMIHRLDLARPGDTASAPPQLVWTAVGTLGFVLVLILVRDHRTLQRYTYTAMVAGLALLVLPLVPGLGKEINGARIWIEVAGFTFQPGEVAKLVLMVFFAGYLVVKRDVLALASKRVLGVDLPRGRDLGPIMLAWAVSLAVLVFERDLGTSVLFFGAFVAMLYIATERRSWLILGVVMVLGGGYAAYNLFSHVARRVDIWLHPFDDPDNASYQLVQSLYGLASGGILGNGLGQGRPQLVPFAKTDFIVAALGEELGLTGLMAILLLYGILVERGLRTAIAARDAFGKLLAAGLSVIVGLQVFIVVGGVTRLIPLTGLTTPFLSYGGSSLVANFALVAMLLRISDAARRPAPQVSEPPGRGAAGAAGDLLGDEPTQAVRR